jgi:hypothetical protein
MAKEIKKDGTYDGRKTAGRQAKGKSPHPKKTGEEMAKTLKNKKGHGK